MTSKEQAICNCKFIKAKSILYLMCKNNTITNEQYQKACVYYAKLFESNIIVIQ